MIAPHDPVPVELSTIAAPVEARLRSLLDEEHVRWIAVDADLGEPLDVLRAFVLAGGKRIRPAFCHWAFVGAGGDPDDPRVVDAGAAFELLHAFALVHDDVMDGSSMRRNEPTVHMTFAERHAARRWNGEARRFGEGIAILVGDLAEVFADRLMTGVGTGAFDVWNELKIELNVGQYLDVLGAARGDVDLATARRIVRYKSGKYTIERPLHLGAALAGGLDRLHGVLSAFGQPLGDAFQLRDDVLGTFGESDITGKPVGDDLREGKPTPLLAIARERADNAQARVLDRVGSVDLDADEIEAIGAVFVATGALAEVDRMIDELVTTAVAALDGTTLAGDAATALRNLAIYVGTRER